MQLTAKMHCWVSGPSSPWEELPMQTSALPSHLRDQDQLIHCLSDSFTLCPYSNTPDALLKVSLSWNTFQICSSALVSPSLEHSAINLPPMSIPSPLTLDMSLCPFICKMDRWYSSSTAAAQVNSYITPISLSLVP